MTNTEIKQMLEDINDRLEDANTRINILADASEYDEDIEEMHYISDLIDGAAENATTCYYGLDA